MIEIKKILYPTDFSEHSLAALPIALDLAERYQARLHCLHVVDSENELLRQGGYIAPMIRSYPLDAAELRQSAHDRLEKFLEEHAPAAHASVNKAVTLGKPFVEIVRYCRQEDIALIVLGTHGHSALASILLGSVAEKVVRKAPCAVLTVRHPEHEFEAP
ncbi:MAG: universal stress protein [Phycisphaerales bacterium]|nr:MAG: universal stress protein [Phycisphaerales bacterium]